MFSVEHYLDSTTGIRTMVIGDDKQRRGGKIQSLQFLAHFLLLLVLP